MVGRVSVVLLGLLTLFPDLSLGFAGLRVPLSLALTPRTHTTAPAAAGSPWATSSTRRISGGGARLAMTLADPPKTAKNGVANKVALVALGCPKNTVDAEVMLGDLQSKGFEIVRHASDADVVIVNTCAFIEDAKKESIEAILEAVQLKDTSAKGVVVTGCMAQRYADELSGELPEVDAVVGFEKYSDIGLRIEEIVTKSGYQMPTVEVGTTDVPFRPEWERYRITQQHSGYLRVAEGCDHKCTFCAIPSWRGRFRSKSFEAIMIEAHKLAASGVTELNLIAEDTNQWGQDFGKEDERRLADLLYEIAKIESVVRIRLLYCYPSYFSEELIDAIANIDKVCKYIDIPLQHIADPVLKRMNRPPRDHTVKLLAKIKERVHGVVLRTTFITGFPGETEEDHKELVDFCNEWGFQRAGVFCYSEEEGTPAALMESLFVPSDRMDRQRDQLHGLIQDGQRRFAEEQVGKTLEVLVDRAGEGGFGSVGRTRFDAPDIDCCVYLAQTFAPGTYVQAEIVDTFDFDLVGDAAGALEDMSDDMLKSAMGHSH